MRVEFVDALYHVVSRGDKAQAVFTDDADRVLFLETLGESCARTGWRVHAFVLMPDHFHLLIETPRANLVAGMKWMLGTYTIRHNVRHHVHGHLFAGRYRAQLISPTPGFLQLAADYIHLNPARAALLGSTQKLRDYRWSSLRHHLQVEVGPGWLASDRLLGPGDRTAATRVLEERLERQRVQATEPPPFDSIRHGWCFGDEPFRSSLLVEVGARSHEHHAGEEVAAAAEARAEALVVEALAQAGWSEPDLQSRPKGDAWKLVMARRLRAESTMTLRWIAARLCMGTPGHLSHLLYWQRRGGKPPKPTRKPRPVRQESPASRSVTAPAQPPPETAPDRSAAPFAFDTSFD